MKLTEYGHLIIDEIGALLKKKRKRLLIITKEKKEEIPLKIIRDVIVIGKVSMSSELIKTLTESGIDLLIATPFGKPIARIVGAKAGGAAENRYEQYKSLNDERGIYIAKAVIIGKLRNQCSNMRYYSKSRRATPEISAKLYEIYEILKRKMQNLENEKFANLDEARKKIMTYEGECANFYWDGMKFVFEKWNFPGRMQNGDDAANICLNVCYNLLSCQIWKYVLRFGLDPFLGYLHVERPGRLSLVFDFMEPFRPMIDRFVASFLRGINASIFKKKKNTVLMELRQAFFSEFLQEKLEYKGRKMMMETVMFYYLQEIVSFLRRHKDSIAMPYMPW